MIIIIYLKMCRHTVTSIILFLFYLFTFRERKGKEREREEHQCVVASHAPLLGTWPATQACAEWELNQGSFGSQASAQSTEPHQPGQFFSISLNVCYQCHSCFLEWLEAQNKRTCMNGLHDLYPFPLYCNPWTSIGSESEGGWYLPGSQEACQD